MGSGIKGAYNINVHLYLNSGTFSEWTNAGKTKATNRMLLQSESGLILYQEELVLKAKTITAFYIYHNIEYLKCFSSLNYSKDPQLSLGKTICQLHITHYS